jgi:uncharacterized membrane protein YdjX (TVP38/TMEM64 family)
LMRFPLELDITKTQELVNPAIFLGNPLRRAVFPDKIPLTKAVRMKPEKQERSHLIAHLIMLAFFLGLIIFVSVKFTPEITRLISRPEKFKEYLASYGPVSALIYILIQMAHIIIVVIPGEIVQMAGGYAFGTVLGTLYSVIGTILGTIIVFVSTRLLGYSLVKTFVSPKRLKEFDFLINSPKSEIAMFVLFLIPGIPKDVLVYVSGLTPVKPLRFLLICITARFPGLLGCVYIGANLQEKDYLPVYILSGIALILFVVGILTKDKIIDALHRLRHPEKGGKPES